MFRIMTVEDSFMVTGRGLVVIGSPYLEAYKCRVAEDYILILPNGEEYVNRGLIETPLVGKKIGIHFPKLTKDDVPIGTEILLEGYGKVLE